MSIEKRIPNLICIGMEKSGTTFLNTIFKKSQSVLTPTKKELFYFNLHYGQGLEWYLSWYDYNSKPDAAYVCDVTPSYFRRRQAIARIKETSPDAKLLVLIRHPVYRAFSHYIHRLRHVGLKLENYPISFQEVLDGAKGKRDIFPPYHETLSLWLEEFERKDILFLSYESELFDPQKVERKMHDFLGIDDLDFGQFRGNRINNGKMPKFYYGGEHGEEIAVNEREFFIPKNTLVFAHVKGTEVWTDIDPAQANMALETSEHWTAKVSSKEIRHIYENFYAHDIAKFSSTFDVDVSDWLKAEPVSYRAAYPGDQFLREANESGFKSDSSLP